MYLSVFSLLFLSCFTVFSLFPWWFSANIWNAMWQWFSVVARIRHLDRGVERRRVGTRKRPRSSMEIDLQIVGTGEIVWWRRSEAHENHGSRANKGKQTIVCRHLLSDTTHYHHFFFSLLVSTACWYLHPLISPFIFMSSHRHNVDIVREGINRTW